MSPKGQFYAPREDEQAYIHDKYMSELVKGVVLPKTREALLRIVETLKDRERVEAVILAGTELPLILTAKSASGIPLLDTTQIHVQAATRRNARTISVSGAGDLAPILPCCCRFVLPVVLRGALAV